MNFTTTKTAKQCVDVRVEYSKSKEWTFYAFLPGDVHWDNPKCNRDLYNKHLDLAKARGACIIYLGDFFCLMEGRYDPRRSKSGIRPEYNKSKYLDLVINDAANKHTDIAPLIGAMFEGNHESAIRRNVETDPLERMCELLSYKSDVRVPKMGYQGYVRFSFHINNANIKSKKLAVHHGKWGGIVSKGTQSVARYSAIFPDADVIATGHTHDQWAVPNIGFRLKRNGDVVQKETLHIKVPTYKDEFSEGHGWATEKIVQPKPLGGYFLKFTYDASRDDIVIQEERAR